VSKQDRKEQIRAELLTRRSGLQEPEYLSKSGRIITRLRGLHSFQNARRIHCYVSMNSRREVNTHDLIKELLFDNRELVVPRTHMDTGSLSHFLLQDFSDLKANKWGVLEPESSTAVPAETLDLVIVPMVGGDLNRNRIGYGKGFYDRFLHGVSCPTVGLLFETCLVDELPVEPFDVPLDVLVTEDRVV
jgi:5-formyltetrahydrofolate cyclo-ligase